MKSKGAPSVHHTYQTQSSVFVLLTNSTIIPIIVSQEVLEWKNLYVPVALKTIDIPSLYLLNKFLSMDN